MHAAGFTTNESSQILLVSVHNVIYPITEYVLHQVFDPYGYVEKIDIVHSSALLQAIVHFDSCQNVVWAKSQLQGRYIYDTCCQLDIQFYKSLNNDHQTRNLLRGNEFAADLNFIKQELQRMIVITDRMQDTVKTMISSIQKFAHTVSKSSKSTNSVSVFSPVKPKVCNDFVAVVSTTSEIHINNGSIGNFENEQKCGRNLGIPGQVLEKFCSDTYLDLLLSYDDDTHNCKSRLMLKLIDLESAHILFERMRGLGVIPQHSHIVDVQVCGVLLSEHLPFYFYKENIEDFSNRTSMDDSSEYAWKMLDNMFKHAVIVEYMKRDKSNSVLKIHKKAIEVFDPGGVYMAAYDQVECTEITSESQIIIFDPDGIFYASNVFNLEDKVVFEGSVMIRFYIYIGSPDAEDSNNLLLLQARPKIKISKCLAVTKTKGRICRASGHNNFIFLYY